MCRYIIHLLFRNIYIVSYKLMFLATSQDLCTIMKIESDTTANVLICREKRDEIYNTRSP